MTYRLALLSDIPLVQRDGVLCTIDLWVKDLQAQVDAVRAVTLFSPIRSTAPADWTMLPLPRTIKVVPLPAPASVIAAEIQACDVVQIPGNSTWKDAGRARSFARAGRRAGKAVVLGISSDRATTHLVNARGKSALHRMRARLRSMSVKISQRHLARHSHGTFVVGEGLRRLVDRASDNIFVGTASWIRASDIVARPAARATDAGVRLCVAARLERMKGIHLALEAMSTIARDGSAPGSRLVIAGQGPEEAALRRQVELLGLQSLVDFVGTFAYPGPFLEFLRSQDVVVLTNLNDEQPRLVFDAISQGCMIVCPDSLPYRALGIPERLLYTRGDAAALAAALGRVCASVDDRPLRATLDALAHDATIESMHERRREWVNATLARAASTVDGIAPAH